MVISDLDKKIIIALQEDLPLSPHPYRELAEGLGIEEELLLSKIQTYLDEGILRRLGAALKHRRIGYQFNAMVVWRVEPHLTKEVGKIMAGFKEVSHCYERPTYPQWPYNIFTMIHGESREECESIVTGIAKSTGLSDYQLLYSSRELKKSSMKYFCQECV